jgi:site-specific DNA recombinase
MRCAQYCRVSLEEQVEQFGLDSQVRALREYAASKGYETREEWMFVDDGYLGGDLDRPALERMRALLRSRSFDVVLAHDPDRLSRKLAHLVILQEEFDRAGVRMEFVTTPVEATPEGRMLLNLKGMFGEYERAKIRERTLRGRREKARQGYIVGGAVPFGYTYLGHAQGERGRLVVNEEQARVVRQIFAWSLERASTREITARLNASGTPPQHATRWGKSSVYRILRNETYVGQAYYNRRQREEPKELTAEHRARRNKKTLLRMRQESEWIPIDVPAVIERELFERVEAKLRENAELLSGRPSENYLLRGLLWCEACGRRFCGSPSHGRRYYRCSGRDRLVDPRCTVALVNAEKVEGVIWAAVTECFSNPRILKPALERHRAAIAGAEANREVRAAELTRSIEQASRREFRARQAMLDVELGQDYQFFRAQLIAARAEREARERDLRALQVAPSQSWDVKAICKEISAALSALQGGQRQVFLRYLVERITLAGREAEISCVLPASVVNRSHHQDDVDDIRPGLSFSYRVSVA